MPQLKHYGPGKRVNVWLLERQLGVAGQIDNFSNFVQIALDNAADIMAWAILKGVDPKRYNTGRNVDDVIDQFNAKYPPNPLTKKRLNKHGPRTQPADAPAHQESNPALR